MKKVRKKPLLILFFITIIGIVGGKLIADNKTEKESAEKQANQRKQVIMDDEQWKKKLSPEQYRILRKAGTERPFGDVYKEFKNQGGGTYVCAGCDTELFSSKEKFDSKCGWPSFYDPSKAKNVKTSVDYHLGYPRTEVLCAVCDGHLGHVFTGEGFDTPTDKRYCINGTVLKFIPDSSPSLKKSEEIKKVEEE
jgi:peptide-methionine (R)-S-oxide reductase